MRIIITALILIAPTLVQAKSWKDSLEELNPAQSLSAKHGHTIHDAPAGKVLKTVTASQKVTVKGKVEWEGKTYYMSDWSWDRHVKGRQANWICLTPDPTAKVEATEPTSETKEAPTVVAEIPAKPMTIVERLEQRFGGNIEVFDKELNLPAPKGHKIFSAPGDGRLLKWIKSKSTFGAKAELTLESGEVYYASTWSWNRALSGSNANWTQVIGNVSRRVDPPAPVSKPDLPFPDVKVVPEDTLQRLAPVVRNSTGDARVISLLIGNGNYSSGNPGPRAFDLETPENDVDLLAKTLRKTGSEVIVAKNQTKAQILDTIEKATNQLNANDTFVLYLSGHGLQLSGKNYFAPIGISFLDKESVLKSAVSVDELIKTLGEKNLRMMTLILDCSRPNPFNHADPSTHLLLRIPGLNLGGKTVLTQSGMAKMSAKEGEMIVMAAKPGEFVVPEPRPGKNSHFATALATSLQKNLDIRHAVAIASKTVSTWSEGVQQPWISTRENPPFYLHTPGRHTTDPDAKTVNAGQWLANEGEKGIPMAIAKLASSIRENPKNNPATAALTFLLSYQSVTVPLNTWGPFAVDAKQFEPDLQISLDGQQIALFPAKDDLNPTLIVDRETGDTISEISGIFSPPYNMAQVSISAANWKGKKVGSLTTIQRLPEGNAPKVHSVTPIMTKDQVVSSAYDEGLERLYLATKGADGKITIREFATTPAVGPSPEFTVAKRQDQFQSGKDLALAEGKTSDATPQQWKFGFNGSASELQLTVNGKKVYSRKGADNARTRLEDWRLSDSGSSLALLFRNRIETLSVSGRKLASFDIPTSGDDRTILSFSPSFRRLVVAQGEAPGARISIFDLGTGRELGVNQSRQGYREYASLSPSHDWFFHYDESGRWRMADLVTGGKLLDLPGMSSQALFMMSPGSASDEEEEFYAPFEVEAPPLAATFADFESAPSWLAELAESVIGFRLDEKDGIDWHENGPKAVQSAMKDLEKQAKQKSYQQWSEWFLQNRLLAVEN